MAQWVLFWSLFNKNGNCPRKFLCKLSNTCLFFYFQSNFEKKSNWPSGYCLALLAPGIVWRFWLSGYCLALLALWVLMAQWYYSGHYFIKMVLVQEHFYVNWVILACFLFSKQFWKKESNWLSGYCLVLLALRVLSGTFGSPGIVWHFWLSGYCLVLLALRVLMAQWVLFWSLFDKNGTCPRTF